jgi:hypothetical protein
MNVRRLYGSPDSWRRILVNLLVTFAGALASNAVLMYGVGLQWWAAAALLVACVVCYGAVRVALIYRRHARLRAVRLAQAREMFGGGHGE